MGGSSPTTRGAPQSYAQNFGESRLIPDYAGSTSPDTGSSITSAGSSPTTRGALLGPTVQPGRNRLIPDYAGST